MGNQLLGDVTGTVLAPIVGNDVSVIDDVLTGDDGVLGLLGGDDDVTSPWTR